MHYSKSKECVVCTCLCSTLWKPNGFLTTAITSPNIPDLAVDLSGVCVIQLHKTLCWCSLVWQLNTGGDNDKIYIFFKILFDLQAGQKTNWHSNLNVFNLWPVNQTRTASSAITFKSMWTTDVICAAVSTIHSSWRWLEVAGGRVT